MQPTSSSMAVKEYTLTPIYPDRALRTTDVNPFHVSEILDHIAPIPKKPSSCYKQIAMIIYGLYVVCSFGGKNNDNKSIAGYGFLAIALGLLTMPYTFIARRNWEAKKYFRECLNSEFRHKKDISTLFCSYLLQLKDRKPDFDRYYRLMSFKQIVGGLALAAKVENRSVLIDTHMDKFASYFRNIFKQLAEKTSESLLEEMLDPSKKNYYICNPYLLDAGYSQLATEITDPKIHFQILDRIDTLSGSTERLLNARMFTLKFSDNRSMRVAREYLAGLSEPLRAVVEKQSEAKFDDVTYDDFRQLTIVLEQGRHMLTEANSVAVTNLARKFELKELL